MKIIALDLECANTYDSSAICWAGLAHLDEKLNIMSTEEILINPKCKTIHAGDITFPFTLDDLKNQPTFIEVADRLFRDFDGDTLIIGHSIINDFLMLISACLKYKQKPFKCRFLDSQLVYAIYKGDLKALNLEATAKEFNIEFTPHNPVEDAIASAKVVNCVLKKMHLTLNEFIEKYGIRYGEVDNFYIRQQEHNMMDKKMKRKTDNINALYDYMCSDASESLNVGGKKLWLKGSLFSNYNMLPVIKFLNTKGYFITYERSMAKIWVGTKPTPEKLPKKKISYDLKEFLVNSGYKQRLIPIKEKKQPST